MCTSAWTKSPKKAPTPEQRRYRPFGLCELNYTSEGKDGKIDISKAVNVNEQFEVSKQFWAYQVEQGVLSNPKSFINNVPHMSFVWG